MDQLNIREQKLLSELLWIVRETHTDKATKEAADVLWLRLYDSHKKEWYPTKEPELST